MLRRDLLRLVVGSLPVLATASPLEILASDGSSEGTGIKNTGIKNLRVQNGRDIYITCPAVALPRELGDTIAKHINAIMEKGYARQLSNYDFFHGHLLFDKDNTFKDPFDWENGAKERCFTLDDYFSSVRAFLYHTREYLNEWVPRSDKNVPRSIVGLMDGSIKIPEIESEMYRQYGTVYGCDQFTVDGMMNQWQEEIPLLSINGHLYRTFPKFHIEPDKHGRFSLNNGQKYELYLVLKEESKNK
ncbi:hypothetical protein HYW21_06940 [Candidatus Woesearchaeota archaeon]|nr:hypothetical protein [Candidatus Woesearchaeota archaeon]